MIRVLLAEDQHLIRTAIRTLIDLEDDLVVVAETDRGDSVEEAVAANDADVAVLDIDMPGLDGITAATRVRSRTPCCRTLILTGLGEPGHVARALEAQVDGFLRKDAPSAELLDAIRRVAAGFRFIDPQLAALALRQARNPLTERELEVLRVAAGGGSVREIAAALHLSTSTARNHLSNAGMKLDARNRHDAVRIAKQNGWLT